MYNQSEIQDNCWAPHVVFGSFTASCCTCWVQETFQYLNVQWILVLTIKL